jgi:hypothetical protein
VRAGAVLVLALSIPGLVAIQASGQDVDITASDPQGRLKWTDLISSWSCTASDVTYAVQVANTMTSTWQTVATVNASNVTPEFAAQIGLTTARFYRLSRTDYYLSLDADFWLSTSLFGRPTNLFNAGSTIHMNYRVMNETDKSLGTMKWESGPLVEFRVLTEAGSELHSSFDGWFFLQMITYGTLASGGGFLEYWGGITSGVNLATGSYIARALPHMKIDHFHWGSADISFQVLPAP